MPKLFSKANFSKANYKHIFLICFAAFQVMVMLYILLYFGINQKEVKTELEAYPDTFENPFHLTSSEIFDTVNLMCGLDYLDMDISTEARRNLVSQPGQMMWFMLYRNVSPTDPFAYDLERAVPSYRGLEKIQKQVFSGGLNFLYDTGGDPEVSLCNWTGTGVLELQSSPLLPWMKYLDFVVLSSLENTSVKGLSFITEINQNMPIVAPVIDREKIKKYGKFTYEPNLVQLPEGFHKLTDGFWALVLPVYGDEENLYELDLVLKTKDNKYILFSGSSLNEPIVALDAATEALGQPIDIYAGATGWQTGWDTSVLDEKLAQINEKYPKIVMIPNAKTNMLALSAMQSLWGQKVQPGKLGKRIKL